MLLDIAQCVGGGDVATRYVLLEVCCGGCSLRAAEQFMSHRHPAARWPQRLGLRVVAARSWGVGIGQDEDATTVHVDVACKIGKMREGRRE